MKDKAVKGLITILFIFLPILDMLRATSIVDVQLLNFSIIELINLILISLSFFLTIPKIKRKHFKYIIGYFLILIIYLGLHLYNTYNFNLSLLTTASHNYLVELYYILRVYIMPILLIVVLLVNKDIFNRNYYLKIIKYLILIISGQIVLLNLFRYSYGSYADETAAFLINKSCFFDVFKSTNYKELLTVGLFYSTNQISLILFMLFPINVYNLYLKPKISNWLLVILQSFSMIIVGTKTATLGCFLILLGSWLGYYLLVLLKKEKHNLKFALLQLSALIVTSGLLLISPFIHYYNNKLHNNKLDNISSKEIIEVQERLKSVNDDLSKTAILRQNSEIFKISPMFYKMYPPENDLDFWLMIAQRDRKINNDYRVLKRDIMHRIMVKNNNKLDKYFGMGYTIGTMDMERDYIYQYFLLGIVGVVLLIGIYIFIYLKQVLNIIKERQFNFQDIIISLAPLAGLITCYFSGHLFGWVSPMIILAMVICLEKVIIDD